MAYQNRVTPKQCNFSPATPSFLSPAQPWQPSEVSAALNET